MAATLPTSPIFPEGSLDEHLESANLLWSDLIVQQREDYIEMFNQLSFNIFGENAGEDRLYQDTRLVPAQSIQVVCHAGAGARALVA